MREFKTILKFSSFIIVGVLFTLLYFLPISEKNILGDQEDSTISLEANKQLVSVTSVIDGDTIKVNIENNVETIRLIGIDTPETVDPRKSVECFGLEASNKMKALIEGKLVYLEVDLSQGDTDKYGRFLRYVFSDTGSNLNLQMIREGFAFEYTYNLPYKYQNEFKLAQTNAQEANLGLWNACR